MIYEDEYRVNLSTETAAFVRPAPLKKKVVVKSYHNGFPVISIESNAFSRAFHVDQIVLPDTLQTIGDFAFERSLIRKISIPSSVKSLGSNCFSDCFMLHTVVLAKDSCLQEIPEKCFYNNYRLSRITFPSSIEKINCSSFENCVRLKQVQLPDTIKDIGVQAFRSCNLKLETLPLSLVHFWPDSFKDNLSIKKIKIHKNIKAISPGFGSIPNLEEIEVDPSNNIYYAKKGILFNKIKKELVAYPPRKKGVYYKIDKEIKTLGSYSFQGNTFLKHVYFYQEHQYSLGQAVFENSSLESIEIPEGILTLPYSTFYGCTFLKKITLPESLTSLGKSAFERCSSLKEINLPRNLISIGARSFYDAPIQEIEIPKLVKSLDSVWNSKKSIFLNIILNSCDISFLSTEADPSWIKLTNIILKKGNKEKLLSFSNNRNMLSNVRITHQNINYKILGKDAFSENIF